MCLWLLQKPPTDQTHRQIFCKKLITQHLISIRIKFPMFYVYTNTIFFRSHSHLGRCTPLLHSHTNIRLWHSRNNISLRTFFLPPLFLLIILPRFLLRQKSPRIYGSCISTHVKLDDEFFDIFLFGLFFSLCLLSTVLQRPTPLRSPLTVSVSAHITDMKVGNRF